MNSGWSTLKPKLLHVAISAAAYAALMRACLSLMLPHPDSIVAIARNPNIIFKRMCVRPNLLVIKMLTSLSFNYNRYDAGSMC